MMSWTLSLMQIRLHFCVTKGHLHFLNPVSQGFQLIIASSARDWDHPFAGCESGSESQCMQTLAKLSPGAQAQRTREIPTSVITAHASPPRPMFCFPIFMENKMPLCCVLNCYTGRRLGIAGLIVLICNNKMLSCAIYWEHMMDLHVLHDLLQICAQVDTGYKVLCRLSQK